MTQSGELRGKRAVVVLAYADIGGAERVALGVARHLLAAEGMDVTVCALTGRDGPARDAALTAGLGWVGLPIEWWGGRLAKVRDLGRVARGLRRLRPDVVLPFTAVPNVLCGLTWRATGARSCVWNQQDVAIPTRVGHGLLHRAVRLTPLFAACSLHVAAFVRAELGAPAGRVRVVPSFVYPVEPRRARGEWRAALGIPERAPVACMVANLHKHKDHETLLLAWRSVLDATDGEPPVLLLAGRDAGTESRVKALAYDLELGRSVRFLGMVDDVPGLLGASDVGVLSSRAEGLSVSVLEYAASGLPVAGTDVPGIREALPSAQHVLLSPPGDESALAESLIRLFGDEDLRMRLGSENAAYVDDVYEVGKALRSYSQLVREALGAEGDLDRGR